MGSTEMGRLFTPRKVFFYILFWGFHWGIFAFGW